MEYNYTAPECSEYELFTDILEQYNTLIAGCVGSGKSVFEEGMIYNILNRYTPDEAELYLIDPKMVELDPWRVVPHCSGYADTVEGAVELLEEIYDRMMSRYAAMKEAGEKKFRGAHIYCFIDEMSDLIMNGGKDVVRRIQKILQLGRAARIHLVCCSQTVSRYSVPSVLQVNLTCSVGLHCKAAIDSRMIIGQAGCEALPLYGKAIVSANGKLETVTVPMYTAKHTEAMRHYWNVQVINNLKEGVK